MLIFVSKQALDAVVLDVPLGLGSTLELEIEYISAGKAFVISLNGESLQTLALPSSARPELTFLTISGPLMAYFMGELEPGKFLLCFFLPLASDAGIPCSFW